MKILIIDTYYPSFLEGITLSMKGYHKAWRSTMDLFFGTSDAYSANLQTIGVTAHEIIANYRDLQEIWCTENGVKLSKNRKWSFRMRRKIVPWIGRLNDTSWIMKTLMAQIEKLSPDIVYIHDLNLFQKNMIDEIRRKAKIVGQIGCAQSEYNPLHLYDLLLTSFPHYTVRYRERGLNAHYFRLGFDSRVLPLLDSINRDIDISFIGGISAKDHNSTLSVLEALAREFNLKWWGYGVKSLPKHSILRDVYQGEAWGLDMYRLLARSKITINRHNKTAENYANNMRLYEATGMGTLLLTDYKDNLSDLFEIEKEVVTYRTAEEAVEKVKYYLSHESEHDEIAQRGQARTLREHTYALRMKEMVGLLERYL